MCALACRQSQLDNGTRTGLSLQLPNCSAGAKAFTAAYSRTALLTTAQMCQWIVVVTNTNGRYTHSQQHSNHTQTQSSILVQPRVVNLLLKLFAGMAVVQCATASWVARYECVCFGLQAVAAGEYHTCGIVTSTSHLLCWGSNSYSQTDVPVDSGGSQYQWQVCTQSTARRTAHRPNPVL